VGKDKNKSFTEEETEKGNKHEELQIKTIMRYYLISLRLEKKKAEYCQE